MEGYDFQPPLQFSTFGSREAWLKVRTSYIGGSDAAAVIGACPWKSSVDLWEEKMGIKNPPDLSDNVLVKYGNDAEEPLRRLFQLDYPQLTVFYLPNNMFRNDNYPFAHTSLDGWLRDENGRFGVLEIKTATIGSKAQKEKWKGNAIPQNYYIQVLHSLMVTGFEFAYVKAQLKYNIEGEEPFTHTKHYYIDRSEVEGDIAFLLEKEREFGKALENGERPPVVLPDI